MRQILLAALLASGCDDRTAPVECAKVLCADDEYCRSVSGAGDSASSESLPECTLVPESCSGTPSCDCLPDCIECSEDDGVYCEAPPL